MSRSGPARPGWAKAELVAFWRCVPGLPAEPGGVTLLTSMLVVQRTLCAEAPRHAKKIPK